MSYEDCIDVVQEWVADQGFLTTAYINRGPAPAVDWGLAQLSPNAGTNDLDFSAIVPQNVTGVAIAIELQALEVTACMTLQIIGGGNIYNRCFHTVQSSAIIFAADGIIMLDADRKCRCVIGAYTWFKTNITVKGWWL